MKIGYARVSSQEQCLKAQISQLKQLGCEKIFQDKQSGKSADRVELNKMLDYARDDDVVYVTKVDRVARNTIDALKIADELASKGAGFVCLDLGELDLNSDVGRVIYTTISAFAEMERKRILQRCNEGREKAREEGGHLGRFPDHGLHAQIRKLHHAGNNKRQISIALKCSRTTVYKVLASDNSN